MLFKDIIGHTHLKRHLTLSADRGRIPHAQLFVGQEGSGTLPMALAYARYVLCGNKNGENTGGDDACNLKFSHWNHPDLHFSFPVSTTDRVKGKAISDDFLSEWRQFVTEQPYGNLLDWYKLIGLENKQGIINVHEAQHIAKKLSFKSYEADYKVLIVWMAEKLHTSASNKLLKLIEEPPDNTLLVLITEDERLLLNTIVSRCQILHFPPFGQHDIAEALVAKKGMTEGEAKQIAHQANGNFNRALDLANNDSEDLVFEEWFVAWVRSAFKAKGNKGAIHDLIQWSEKIARAGREVQKKFLEFCLEMFRQAMLINYHAEDAVFLSPSVSGFQLEKFAPFVHGNNIKEVYDELQDAIYHIERNANAKVVLTDLSIKLTRLLHKKAA